MVIEWLRFQVPEQAREAFLRRDEEVWSSMERFPGYLGKEVWIDPENSEVAIAIRWQSAEAWAAVPAAEIARLNWLMGELNFPLVESRRFQVRRFLH